MAVWKIKGKEQWGARIYIGINPETGKKDWKKKTTFKSQRAAELWFIKHQDEFKYELQNKKPSTIINTVFSDYVDKYAEKKRKEVKGSSMKQYSWLYKLLKIELGNDTKLKNIKKADVELMYARLSAGRLKNSSMRHLHFQLRGIFKSATEDGIITDNFMTTIKTPKSKPPVMQFWTETELKQFLNTAKKHRMYIFWLIMASTGMRNGEVAALRWRDIDFKNLTINVNKTYGFTEKGLAETSPKTKASYRIIQISQTIIDQLVIHRDKQKKYVEETLGIKWNIDFIVNSTRKLTHFQPPNVGREFEKVCQLAGVKPIRVYDLRHTHATILMSQGVPIKVVQERMGHSSAAITMDVYSHVEPRMQKEAAAKLDHLFTD